MNKYFLYLILLILAGTGVSLKFSTSHEKMPIGCDEFGYLNMAKAISEGKTFDNHTERPYLNKLLDTLRKSSITENEISWMVTPHAYHVLPGTNQIINQYPPGTSLLLSVLPMTLRQLISPLLSILILVIPVLFIQATNANTSFTVFDILFPIIIFLMMVSAPFTTELSRINSLAPTFGLLFAGGILLNRRPFLAVFLISLSINFRLVNALMILPVILFLPFREIFKSQHFRYNLNLILKFTGITLLAVVPLLFYNYNLTGNPFAITYSVIDQKFTPINNIITNASFYFDPDQRWLMVHLAGILFLAVLFFMNRINLGDALKTGAFVLVNYGFFMIHDVKMDYYPYASSIILSGFTIGQLDKISISGKYTVISKTVFLIMTFLILFTGINKYRKKEHKTFTEAKQQYNALCAYDIVWGDLYSGTSEYVCNNSGFRYGTTTPRARKLAIQFLQNNHYKQAILITDNPIDESTIQNEIRAAGLTFHMLTDSLIGKILIIE